MISHARWARTRTAAWSVPAITLAVAAPANAATSGCKVTTGLLSWDTFTHGSLQTGKALATSAGTGVTVTISVSGDTSATNNGTVTSTSTGNQSKVMRFYDVDNKANTAQTVTLTFSAAVTGIAFSLLDVDSSPGNYQDLVVINTAGCTGVKHSNILSTSDGTAAHPYRAISTNSPEPGTTSTSNVDLSWSASRTSVSFTYAQDGTNGGGPFIGISDITFQRCL